MRMESKRDTTGPEDERAVSPVIGVILMVAITVILAAVIAGILLDFGNILEDSPPTTGADVSVNSDWTGSGDDMVYIIHSSGDTLDPDTLQIKIRDTDGQELDSGTIANDGSHTLISLSDTNFGPGATITIEDDGGTGSWSSGDEINIQLIHDPSGATIIDTTVTLP